MAVQQLQYAPSQLLLTSWLSEENKLKKIAKWKLKQVKIE